jgi:Ni/Co efflux regulator RcnB
MLRVSTIVAIAALALPTLALAQQPPQHGKPAQRVVRPAAHPAPRVMVHPRGPVVHGPMGHGPVVHGPIVHGPVVHGPAVVLRGPHGPWMFHGHSYAWHPVHFPHPWAYPPGYGYRLWAVGAILPPLFWQRPDYYYTGWAEMGLPPPDPGYQYVEYGPDLLLVNVGTGEVVQVFPGAFS